MRFWWLKRLLVGGGVLLLVLVAVRLGWGWMAHRLLQAEIEKCIAAGEPIYPQDFNPKEPVPDNRNAAKSLMDAAAALTLTTDQEQLIVDIIDRNVGVQAHVDDIKNLIKANTAVFSLAREARSKPDVDWGVRIATPAVNTFLPRLTGQRALSRVLLVSSAGLHSARDDDEALV